MPLDVVAISGRVVDPPAVLTFEPLLLKKRFRISKEQKKFLQRGNVVNGGLVVLISVRIRRQCPEILTDSPNWQLHKSD